MAPLDRDGLRTTLAGFDDERKKIVGGLIAVMLKHAQRVRDREWISEQYAQVALLAVGFDDVEKAGVYLRANAEAVLGASYLLFQCVGDDLAGRATDGFSFEDAMVQAMSYFVAPGSDSGGNPGSAVPPAG
ncbi:MAG: hypothetical protein AAF682_13070 [Planctomycetota bacterium]